jgi:hypothetical protein
MKKNILGLAFGIFLFAAISPAFGLSISVSGGDSGQVTSNSVNYNLDSASSMNSQTMISGGESLTTLEANGSGAISATSGGVNAVVAGSDLNTNMEMSGDHITGGAILSGVPFGIDAQPGLAFDGDALTLAPDGTIKSLGTVQTGPAITATGGNAAAYILMGRKWTQTDPQIKMSLKDDALLAATGMSKTNVLGAVTAATNTWDDATNQNLFSDSGALLTTTANWKYDGVNNMAFTPYAAGCSAIAATGVWYKTQGIPAGQMYPIVESDMTFNSNLKWTATGEAGKLDFQSAALHELGHTIGLGDLYGRAEFSTDTRQVMHYYTGVKRTLGNGDATGVWKLYG